MCKNKQMNKVLKVLVFLVLSALFTCCQNDNSTSNLEKQIKELKHEVNNIYKPGFGVIMGSIQAHHAKLWFSGKNKNWKLAKFEVHEIEERFKYLEKFQGNKLEAKNIPMIKPALNSIEKAINESNIDHFKNNFKLLTETCNSCHKITNHEFIEIKIPDLQLNINQVFSPNK